MSQVKHPTRGAALAGILIPFTGGIALAFAQADTFLGWWWR